MEAAAALRNLGTEQLNPATTGIDRVSTIEMLHMINKEDKTVADVVAGALYPIAAAVDLIAGAFQQEGRLVYVGAGTSGRLGVMDASECPPTFGVPGSMVVGLIAGGDNALRHPIEGAEDDVAAGRSDLEGIQFTSKDFLVGIAASGRTPYVIGALQYATQLGAKTAALSCVAQAAISPLATVAIEVPTGPEVIGGSTRLKAGTAQKMVLNMLSTGSMVKIGKVYQNMMIDVVATNEKLLERALNITQNASGAKHVDAEKALQEAGNSVKLAVYMLKTGDDPEQGKQALQAAGGRLQEALRTAGGGVE